MAKRLTIKEGSIMSVSKHCITCGLRPNYLTEGQCPACHEIGILQGRVNALEAALKKLLIVLGDAIHDYSVTRLVGHIPDYSVPEYRIEQAREG